MRRSARVLGSLVAVVTFGAACAGPTTSGSSDATPSAAPSSSPTGSVEPSPSEEATTEPATEGATEDEAEDPGPAYSTWELGASPLPVDADGFGEVRPTPRSLRVRRYPTVDLLPPPPGERFVSTIGPVTPALRARMGATWSSDCPVGLGGLRYVTVSFRGFDGAAHTGELVVAAEAADDLVSVFRSLYAADYPIEEMRLPTTADLEAPPTGDGNNTGAFVCRPSTGQSQWSAHAYGLAIDVNPFLNPYVKGGLVLPELASSYLDRERVRPGMILDGDPVVRAFAEIGWSWGGDWRTLKDYQHFSALDR